MDAGGCPTARAAVVVPGGLQLRWRPT